MSKQSLKDLFKKDEVQPQEVDLTQEESSEEQPIEIKKDPAFNCPECNGEGLFSQFQVCPRCLGTGKV